MGEDIDSRQMSPKLVVGIVIFPLIFAWFTLKKGYSKRAKYWSFGWLIMTMILAFGDRPTPEEEAQWEAKKQAKAEAKAAEERQDKIENGFSPWDGSHIALTRLIKNNMNDPSSYEHVETKYWDLGGELVVQTRFRGRNGFGGLVLDSVKAKCSIEGDVLEIVEE